MPARFHVRIARSAEKDVEKIWTYIAADSPEQASNFILQLEKQIVTLERFPQRCHLIPENELLGTEYRNFVYGNYRGIFRISGKTVYVLRIIHGARLLDSSVFET